MENEDGMNEWYLLENLKATSTAPATMSTSQSNQNVNKVLSKEQQNTKDDWFNLHDHGNIPEKQSKETEVKVQQENPSLSLNNQNSSIDFIISDVKDGLSINTNSLLESSEVTPAIQSPRSARLNLQESVDGEISDYRHSGSSGKLSGEGNNSTNALLQEAENHSTFTQTSIHQLEEHEWMSLTSNNIQDVNRPEPVGRTDIPQNFLPTSTNKSIFSSVTRSPVSDLLKSNYSNSNSSDQETNRDQSIPFKLLQEKGNNNTRINTKALDNNEMGDRSTPSKQTDNIESDIPDLSYTQSSVESHRHKQVGPAQDVDLQHATDYYLSSTLTSHSSSKQSTESKISNETPVTKLLGPAYKQTEKFLKDLKRAKFSYHHDKTGSSVPSKDESCQAGESKLDYSKVPFTDNEFDNEDLVRTDLIEQDIASASLVETETFSTKYKNVKRMDPQISDDQRDSEGELLLNELSISSKLNSGNSASQITFSSLEPIKEIKSPERKMFSPEILSSEQHSPPRSIPMAKSPSVEILHQNIPNYHSTDINSRMEQSESPPHSTATPTVKDVWPSEIAHGIYDIRDSTSPGSTNRRRLLVGKIPKNHHRQSYHDPFKVYVSEGSKFTTSIESNTERNEFLLTKELPNRDSSLNGGIPLLTKENIKNRTRNAPQSPRNIPFNYCHDDNKSTITTGNLTSQYSDNLQQPFLQYSPEAVLPTGDSKDLVLASNKTSPSYRETTASFLSSDNTTLTSHSSPDDEPRNRLYNKSNSNYVPKSSLQKKEYDILQRNPLDIDNDSGTKYTTSSTDVTESSVLQTSIDTKTNGGTLNLSSNHHNVFSATKHSGIDMKRQEKFRSASLDQLWRSFEKSYRSANKEKSPLLKKLEAVSTLLNESRRRSSMLNDFSDTSDPRNESFGSYCESHSSLIFNGNKSVNKINSQKERQYHQKYNSNNKRKSCSIGNDNNNNSINKGLNAKKHERYISKDNTSVNETPFRNYRIRTTNNICPLCRRREVGVNFPTPSNSDYENSVPKQRVQDEQNKRNEQQRRQENLTLQAWTQTSPYIIDTPSQKHNFENDSNLNHAHRKNTSCLQRKDTFTIKSPQRHRFHNKSDHNKNKYNTITTTDNKSVTKDVPFTAWFHSIRSDVSEVMPLSTVPTLNSLYSDHKVKIMNRKNTHKEDKNYNLQDAFVQHKQQFIKRSNQRLQEVKDARLQEKHGERVSEPPQRLPFSSRRKQTKQNSWVISKATSNRNTMEIRKELFMRRLSEESPRYIQRLEEQRMENIRNNRLKMKQYDLQNRKRFLQRRSNKVMKHPQFTVVRH